MAQFKFLKAYDVMKPEMIGGGLVKHFNAGDVIAGTLRVQQLEQWGAPNANWVDTTINGQVYAIPATFLTSASEIPRPLKAGGILAVMLLLFIIVFTIEKA